MSNVITEQLDEIIVKELNRATILDGKLFQYYVELPLTLRDEVVAKYFDTLSANVYYNDPINNIYHYTSNDSKDYNIHINGSNTLSAQNITATNVNSTTLTATNATATNITATNYDTTSLSSTSLSATTTNFWVNMSSLGQGFSTSMKFIDVVDALNVYNERVNDTIAASEDVWSSLSAINIINGNTTTTLTPKMLKFVGSDVMEFSYSNKRLTIGVSEIHNKATVKNGVIIFTN